LGDKETKQRSGQNRQINCDAAQSWNCFRVDVPIQTGSLDPPVRNCEVPYLAREDEGQRSAC
jgi:hypothetical protein